MGFEQTQQNVECGYLSELHIIRKFPLSYTVYDDQALDIILSKGFPEGHALNWNWRVT